LTYIKNKRFFLLYSGFWSDRKRIMKKIFIPALFFVIAAFPAVPEPPEWVHRLPFSDDCFYGSGSGSSLEESMIAARRTILMQLSSHVESAVTVEEISGGRERHREQLDSFFGSNSLRGAVLVDEHFQEGVYWVLMQYPAECGKRLMDSAILRFEEEAVFDIEAAREYLSSQRVVEAVRLKWRLGELNLDDYQVQNIHVTLKDKKMEISLYNFLPDTADFSAAQALALEQLGATLLKELQSLSYQAIELIGHANPTGKEGEEEELIFLSRRRAEIMAETLAAAGLTVHGISWAGGDFPLNQGETDEERGRNRRVEIIVSFDED